MTFGKTSGFMLSITTLFGPIDKRLSRYPFTVESRVRFPLGLHMLNHCVSGGGYKAIEDLNVCRIVTDKFGPFV